MLVSAIGSATRTSAVSLVSVGEYAARYACQPTEQEKLGCGKGIIVGG